MVLSGVLMKKGVESDTLMSVERNAGLMTVYFCSLCSRVWCTTSKVPEYPRELRQNTLNSASYPPSMSARSNPTSNNIAEITV